MIETFLGCLKTEGFPFLGKFDREKTIFLPDLGKFGREIEYFHKKSGEIFKYFIKFNQNEIFARNF